MLILSEEKNMDISHFKQHAFNHLFVLIMRTSTLVLFLCHHYCGPSWCPRGFETVSQKILEFVSKISGSDRQIRVLNIRSVLSESSLPWCQCYKQLVSSRATQSIWCLLWGCLHCVYSESSLSGFHNDCTCSFLDYMSIHTKQESYYLGLQIIYKIIKNVDVQNHF